MVEAHLDALGVQPGFEKVSVKIQSKLLDAAKLAPPGAEVPKTGRLSVGATLDFDERSRVVSLASASLREAAGEARPAPTRQASFRLCCAPMPGARDMTLVQIEHLARRNAKPRGEGKNPRSRP